MAEGRIKNTELSAIAAAIRQKNGSAATYKPGEMAAAIRALPGASTLGSKSISANGNYNPASDNLDGYSSVAVNVPNSYAAADEGKVVSNGVLVAQTARSSSITENGTYDTTLNNEVTVNVSGGGGATILTGSDVPSSNTGANGNIYLAAYGGSSVTPVSGYTFLGSLAVTTAGPYIKTGVTYTSQSYCEIDFQYTGTPGDNTWFYGVWVGYHDSMFGYYGGNIIFYIGGTGIRTIPFDTNRHTVSAVADGVYYDGTKVLTPNWNNVPTGSEIYLFSDNGHSPGGNIRIFGCKIYNGATLVRNFIPLLRDSDSVPGMYDTVNDVFYTNAGSGSFTATATIPGNIYGAYVKVNGAWTELIGANINDVGGVS